MNISKYRRYLTDNMEMVIIYHPPGKKHLPVNCMPIATQYRVDENHPDVLCGKAHCINKNTMFYGYKLTANPEIIRPVYCYERECLRDYFHLEFSNKYLAFRRRAVLRVLSYILYLPISVIRVIAEMTY